MKEIKIAIGTAQFGLDYGISNKNGKVSLNEIDKILEFARSVKIDTIDTAQGYGDSEQVLSNFDLSHFKIVTKVIGDAKLEKSLDNLKLSRIYALMFHREDEVNDETWKRISWYKNQQLVSKVGVSVYSPEKLLQLINYFPIDIVQFPLNILDQRFLPLLPELKKKNIEVHVRSVFLQGLLLMKIEEVNNYFSPIKPLLQQITQPKLANALGFPKSIHSVDKMVVGCTNLHELQEIYENYTLNATMSDYQKFMINDEKYINPSHWRLNV